MGDLFGVLLAVGLLAGNAFFVAAEFALISARRDRLEALVAQGRRRASAVIEAGEQLSLMLAASQLGITICSILLGKVAEPAIAHLIEAPLHLVGLPDGLLHPVSFAIAMTLIVVLHILLGEMVPKNIALAGPERCAMLLVPAHLLFIKVVRPVIAFYNLCANSVLKLLRVEPKDELDVTISAVELSEMIGESRSEGLMDAEEHRRLTQALGSTDRTVADVLIPLARVRCLDARAAGGVVLGAVEQAVLETGFSRYPIRRADGTLTGYLHLKDVLAQVLGEAGPDTVVPAADIRPLPTMTTATTLGDALAALRRSGAHLGTTVDDTGTVVGIVALEDLVEEYVGTVRDGTHRAGARRGETALDHADRA